MNTGKSGRDKGVKIREYFEVGEGIDLMLCCLPECSIVRGMRELTSILHAILKCYRKCFAHRGQKIKLCT